MLYSNDLLKDGIFLISRDSHSEESGTQITIQTTPDLGRDWSPDHPVNIIKSTLRSSSHKGRSILKENPGEEILRCGRHRRKVKFVLALIDPVKKVDRVPLRMTSHAQDDKVRKSN